MSRGPLQRAMAPGDLEAVMAIEAQAYSHPWSHSQFAQSLAMGQLAEVRLGANRQLQAYYVAMQGVEEMHLLNLTVAAPYRRQGHARALLQALVGHCERLRASQLLLEVRASNASALTLYRRAGFVTLRVRRGYYPGASGQREDGVEMQLRFAPERRHDLD